MSAALRIGTRASPLALAQAAWVAERINGPTEIVRISCSGDRGEGEDKRRWVDEIELALAAGRVDLAVHSAKDVPGELAAGLEIAGAPRRADPRDALCGEAGSLAELGEGARVGTNSLRRGAQLAALRPDLQILPLRGNVDTRLRRLGQGDFDAILLAQAGLERLGRTPGRPLDELVPAPGQGTLALEARVGDERVREAIEALRDAAAERALRAERALADELGAGCHTPLGAHAGEEQGGLVLRAFVGLPDGSAWIRDELRGPEPEALGRAAGRRLLAAGAAEMLAA
ncbi:MAG: hydroxymethylbilane synthase [Solirubrobacteraceae bacterium]